MNQKLVYYTIPPLSDLVLFGVGYHHAGMDVADRKAIENMFTAGDLPVLCMLNINHSAFGVDISFHPFSSVHFSPSIFPLFTPYSTANPHPILPPAFLFSSAPFISLHLPLSPPFLLSISPFPSLLLPPFPSPPLFLPVSSLFSVATSTLAMGVSNTDCYCTRVYTHILNLVCLNGNSSYVLHKPWNHKLRIRA